MNPSTENKIVLVTRATRLHDLVRRFNTVEQARFYVEHLGADFSDYLAEDDNYGRARRKAEETLASQGRMQVVDRAYLPNFMFGPKDTVVVLGQDGLVANTLKYLDGQPVLGVNPDPARWDGQLLPFKVGDLPKVLPDVLRGGRPRRSVTMAAANLNNGQTLLAVNDLFIGPRSHGSARYRIVIGEQAEHQSSSGVIVSTGLGSTGWFASLVTGATAIADIASTLLGDASSSNSAVARGLSEHAERPLAEGTAVSKFPWEAPYLYFTVREPFPSNTTKATLVFGRVTREAPLVLVSEMAEQGVIFSDGIEKDFLDFNAGARAVISLAERKGCLVT